MKIKLILIGTKVERNDIGTERDRIIDGRGT
jgi:hypothetical protein